MPRTSVDAQAPPRQDDAAASADEDRILGEFHPSKCVRLTLNRRDSRILLLRHRINIDAGADIAARVICNDGAVTVVKWDEWHLKHQPVWMGIAEDWIREVLEAEA